MNIKNLVLLVISAIGFGYFLNNLLQLSHGGELLVFMESVATHPYFKIVAIVFGVICMIAMPFFFIMSKKEHN